MIRIFLKAVSPIRTVQRLWSRLLPLLTIVSLITAGQAGTVAAESAGAPTASGSSICGSKYNDVNGNGVQDSGESGIPGWTIELLDAAGNVTDTAITSTIDGAGRAGAFCFNNVKAGSYTVREVAQTGWVQTQPTAPGTYSVTVGAGTAPGSLLFGNMLSPAASSVCGIKFEDKNGNGRQDPGDLGLDGWTIAVTDAEGHGVATVVTDKNGTFCFKDLRPGVYTFAEVMKPGWQQTFPSEPGTHTVKVVGGQNAASVDFGNQKQPDPCCLSFRFLQGRADNFATADGAEPAQPSAALVQDTPSSVVYAGFDGTVEDTYVAHTFSLPVGNCVQSALLEFKARPIGGHGVDDTVRLRFSGVPGSPLWNAFLAGSPGLVATAWWHVPNYSAGHVFSLDLASLPGGVNLIPTLNAQRFLDFEVQNGTSVDYALLTVTFCECASSDPKPVDGSVNRPRPSPEPLGVNIRLVLDSSDATVNGEASRLPAPAVSRDGSTLVPLRWIGEAVGAEVKWDMAERRATYMLGERKVELWIDKLMARVNGEDVALSIAPTLIDGSTFVPLRFLGEAFGLTVKFNPDDRSITIFDRWGNRE